jgi:hypothetical protein
VTALREDERVTVAVDAKRLAQQPITDQDAHTRDNAAQLGCAVGPMDRDDPLD